MASVVIDYNIVQIIVWSLIAVIAYFIQRSVSKTNDHICTITNSLSTIQNTLNQIQTSLNILQALSQIQIGKVEVKETSEDDIAKEMDGKLNKIIKILENIESEDKEESIER